jgi:hypothetical protein
MRPESNVGSAHFVVVTVKVVIGTTIDVPVADAGKES